MIEIPDRMKWCPLWQGKYPIFYVVFTVDGVPDFKVVDVPKQIKCCNEKLCHLCGFKLGKHMVFIGGPLSCSHGHFADGPMHEECALYATKACPYLNNAHYTAGLKESKFEDQENAGVIIKLKHVETGRPAKMGMYYTTGYRAEMVRGSIVFTAKPATKIVWDAMPQREE